MGQWDELLQDFEWGPDTVKAERERAQLRAVEAALEEKYSDRGLHFTDGFCLLSPQESFGWLDGQRFYYRFYRDRATIRVGPFNEELEARINAKEREIRARRRLADYAAWERHEMTGPELMLSFAVNRDLPKASPDDMKYVPRYITQCAYFNGYTGNPYTGHLPPGETARVFSELIENLEDVNEEDRVSDYIKEWLDS